MTQRKQRMCQLLLREAKEKIGLVLGQIRRALENPSPARGIEFVDGVVAGGDVFGADAASRREQLVELEMVVAKRAGNRRASGQLLIDKRANHVALESLFLIYNVIRNAKVFGNTPRIVQVVERAAAPRLGRIGNAMLACEASLVPELKREPDDGLALVGEDRRSRGRVDPSGH